VRSYQRISLTDRHGREGVLRKQNAERMSGVILAIPRFHESKHTAGFKCDCAALRIRHETETLTIKYHLKWLDANVPELDRTKTHKKGQPRVRLRRWNCQLSV